MGINKITPMGFLIAGITEDPGFFRHFKNYNK